MVVTNKQNKNGIMHVAWNDSFQCTLCILSGYMLLSLPLLLPTSIRIYQVLVLLMVWTSVIPINNYLIQVNGITNTERERKAWREKNKEREREANKRCIWKETKISTSFVLHFNCNELSETLKNSFLTHFFSLSLFLSHLFTFMIRAGLSCILGLCIAFSLQLSDMNLLMLPFSSFARLLNFFSSVVINLLEY